jgi:hypothetical protein
VLPGIQEHENRVQLSPGKGYLIGNEPEIWRNSNACSAKGKQIRRFLFYGDIPGKKTLVPVTLVVQVYSSSFNLYV